MNVERGNECVLGMFVSINVHNGPKMKSIFQIKITAGLDWAFGSFRSQWDECRLHLKKSMVPTYGHLYGIQSPSFFYLLCWIWFSWNVHRIDMRHWLLILTMMSLLCLILTSIDFVIFFSLVVVFICLCIFFETLSLKLTIPHSHHSAHFEIKVNKVSFLLPFLTTAINNSFISILYWLVHCVGLHQFNFNVNYE